MHIEFLVEDSSGEKLLAQLLPHILGEQRSLHTWRLTAYKGIGRTTFTDSLAKLTGEEEKSSRPRTFAGVSERGCSGQREKASHSRQTPSTPAPQIQFVEHQSHDFLQFTAKGARGLRLTLLRPRISPKAHEDFLFRFDGCHDLAFP